MKTTVIVEVELEKPVPDLAEKIAARAYTLQGVKNVRSEKTSVPFDNHMGIFLDAMQTRASWTVPQPGIVGRAFAFMWGRK